MLVHGASYLLRLALCGGLLLLALPLRAQGPALIGPAEIPEEPPPATAADAPQKRVALQLRIAWGGGAAQQWTGQIELRGGRIKQLQTLGIESDEPGSIWSDDAGVHIAQPSPRTYDAIDLTVEGDADAALDIMLTPRPGETEGRTISIDLATLIAGTHRSDLDDKGNQLFVRRTPGDRLRVRHAEPSLVLTPGKTFSIDVEPYRIGRPAAGEVTLRGRLQAADGGATSWEETAAVVIDAAGSAPPHAFRVPLPEAEGVYDLVFQLEQTRQGLAAVNPLNPLQLRSETLLVRRVQLVLISPARPAAPTAPPPATLIDEINPTKPWWEKLTALPQIPGWRKGPLDNGDAGLWMHPELGIMSRIGNKPKPDEKPSGETSWAAYPLQVSDPGQVHILEIEYPTDVPQAMGISLVEPGASGAVQPLGVDSGIFVPDSAAEGKPRLARHRIAIWPRTETPIVLITNRHPRLPAVHGKIRLLGPEPASVRTLRFSGSGSHLPPFQAVPEGGRQLLAFYQRPLFAENFSAPEAYDESTGRTLDDWRTFHQGATRMIEYLHYAGYDGASISVLSAGAAIYPSEQLAATPRYDTGMFFITGQDPERKDVAEMLFRLFDRERMTLIPALHFAAPLPRLEAVLREGHGDAVGVELIGADGESYIERHGTTGGAGPYYNPLNPVVQQAIREVVVELAERYKHHPSFGGITLDLAAGSYVMLPGAEWGFDDHTIARFQRDTGIQVPGDGPQRFAARARFLLGERRSAWLEWRGEVLHAFHARLLADLQARVPDAKLYLAGDGLITSPDLQRLVQPALPQPYGADEVLQAAGIIPELYAEGEGLCLLRPRTITPANTPATLAFDRALNESPQIDRHWLTARRPGSVFLHQPDPLRVPSFDEKSPFGANNTLTWLANQLQPAGAESRRRFVHSLATLDVQVMFDGGWMLPMGQEAATADVLAAYRSLPAKPFATVPGVPQPITIRTARHGTEGYLYLCNDAPWQARLSIDVEGMPAWEELTGRRELSQVEGGRWILDMRPYDLIAVKFASGLPRIGPVRVTFPNRPVRDEMEQQIRQLVSRAAALHTGQSMAVVTNADFEAIQVADVEGWNLVGSETARAAVNENDAQQGRRSVRLTNGEGVASLISQPFAAPDTGRLAVSVWMRKRDPRAKAPIRIAVGGRYRGRDYYRYANAPVTNRWEQYIFQIDDLPLAGLSDVQVRFDMMGAGEVAIDNIELFDQSFTENERKELSKIISLASFNLGDDKLADCARVLDSYWPRFLMDRVELPPEAVAVQEPVTPRPRPADPPPPEDRNSSRWRSLLPGFLR